MHQKHRKPGRVGPCSNHYSNLFCPAPQVTLPLIITKYVKACIRNRQGRSTPVLFIFVILHVMYTESITSSRKLRRSELLTTPIGGCNNGGGHFVLPRLVRRAYSAALVLHAAAVSGWTRPVQHTVRLRASAATSIWPWQSVAHPTAYHARNRPALPSAAFGAWPKSRGRAASHVSSTTAVPTDQTRSEHRNNVP